MKVLEHILEEPFELEFTCKKNSGYRYEDEGCGTRVLLSEEDIFGMMSVNPNDDEKGVYRCSYICPECGKTVFVPEKLLPKIISLRIYRKYLKEDKQSAWKERRKQIYEIQKSKERLRMELLTGN